MNTLKHKILEHLVLHGELNLEPADERLKGKASEIGQAAQELDQSGHGVYTRTMDRLYLAKSDQTIKAFEDGVYAEKAIAPSGSPVVDGISVDSAPKVDGANPPVKVAKATAKTSSKKKP